MGAGAYLEPLAVIVLLFGGAWINRATDHTFTARSAKWEEDQLMAQVTKASDDTAMAEQQLPHGKRPFSPSLLTSPERIWRERDITIMGYTRTTRSPDTAVFQDRLLSRLLRKFPFLVEVWYWALIYWVNKLDQPEICRY
jgi:hypothetical protein